MPGEEEEAVADARRWQLPEAEIVALKAALWQPLGAGFAGVWPDNRKAVDAFLFAASQWRTATTMVERRMTTLWIGLDYAGIRVALDARGIALDADLMTGIQIMEQAARNALNRSTAT
ncbi:DUF1799 domain-containing protein [Mesorhizobium sp. DCY119]|uniref:DUF1799 domain-containing protein n=1 Tax=Mesorhizobium sp. DCY119 TaxID=2108445 RepID=UPI0013C508AE|nr:DUF1799 domain-containing protein [Mesorhizobium sp. DCY119]